MTREYKRQKISGLEGKSYVLFDAVDDSWHISISGSEIKLEGTFTIGDHEELQFFAQLTSKAWQEKQRLIPRIVTSAEIPSPIKTKELPEWMRLK